MENIWKNGYKTQGNNSQQMSTDFRHWNKWIMLDLLGTDWTQLGKQMKHLAVSKAALAAENRERLRRAAA